ncbi:isoleucine--tRNA ligase [Thermogymnomonas acidicola]|uniref:Isoleucine--tRNA ligase n=1 Tax=Thermogymnomonas acidicola TaxID=399579 RepID=A0AA37BRV6_9ARCH|nr:isoleucine--tRNA ligase [Thermogymnomonas acidicola]
MNTSIGLNQISREVLDFWEREGTVKRVLSDSSRPRVFSFLEGPPTANGRPHVGHAMTRTIKDIVLRYKYMQGYSISRRYAGWDCHGLPVELEAEKHFGFKVKKEIEDFGIEKFNSYCRESIFRYVDEWEQVDRLLGFWIDHSKAYVTLRNEYIESEWWALKNLYSRGLLVKDFKIVPYCPRCETSLSSHEVSQGYEEVKDPSVYVKFPVRGQEGTFFLAWTTTPWTLPSNEFLAVNPDFDYSLILVGEEKYYMATAAVDRVMEGKQYREEKRLKGSELLGMEYERPIDFIPAPDGSCRVVGGSHVTLEEGTGIVHTAPAFGAEDFEIGRREGVAVINPVNASGKFEDDRLPWSGLFVKDADPKIISYLKGRGLLFRSGKVSHTYPFCYRCGTPLLYYPLEAWFIKVSRIREELQRNNSKINWYPDHLKDGRFGNFLAEAKDWALSRNRYWGTPLPVWDCSNGHTVFLGSMSEIRELGGEVPKDLHRPYIDQVTLKCPECGGEMRREPYVIDTWFDSGSATYAAMHYPFSKDFDPSSDLPVDFITEAIDQTRGWFYTLHVISSLLFQKNAYSNVLSIDFILDEQGRKMSKSKGNSVYALDFINEFGADAVRLFFLSNAPWRPKAIDRKLILEMSRKTIYTMLNVYQFFASNANLDGYMYRGLVQPKNILDRWIVSRVNSTVRDVTREMDNYQVHTALKLIMDLIDDISNFYLRLSRRRFWSDEMGIEKERAYSSLFYAMLNTVKMMAPLTPFFSEYLYKRLVPGGGSVHEERYPVADPDLIDREIEGEIEFAKTVIEGVRRLRQESGIKGRQPVTEILISAPGSIPEDIIEIIAPECNARSVRYIAKEKRPLMHQVRVNMSRAAPVLRSKVRQLQAYVESTEQEEIYREVSEKGYVTWEDREIEKDMLEITEVPDPRYAYLHEAKSDIDIFLNKEIDEDLEMEGLAREVIRRVQVMRKEMDLEYDERIVTTVECSDRVKRALQQHMKMVKNETLSDSVIFADAPGGKEWEIEGEKVRISIKTSPA